MQARLLALWLAVLSSGIVALFSCAISRWVGLAHASFARGARLAALSELFYFPSTWPYFFFVPLAIWALWVSFAKRKEIDHVLLAVSGIFSCTLAFLMVFLVALVLPWCPTLAKPMQPVNGPSKSQPVETPVG